MYCGGYFAAACIFLEPTAPLTLLLSNTVEFPMVPRGIEIRMCLNFQGSGPKGGKGLTYVGDNLSSTKKEGSVKIYF